MKKKYCKELCLAQQIKFSVIFYYCMILYIVYIILLCCLYNMRQRNNKSLSYSSSSSGKFFAFCSTIISYLSSLLCIVYGRLTITTERLILCLSGSEVNLSTERIQAIILTQLDNIYLYGVGCTYIVGRQRDFSKNILCSALQPSNQIHFHGNFVRSNILIPIFDYTRIYNTHDYKYQIECNIAIVELS